MTDADRRELERVVRGWLLQRPKPASLRLVVGDEVRSVAIPANATWATIAATVVRMSPDQVEALDAGGAILRATDFAELAGAEEQPRATIQAPPPAADEVPVAAFDPETQRFALVARLIADAYKHASHSTDQAFERLAQIAERADTRTASLERAVDSILKTERARLDRYQRELEEREEELEEEADKKGNGAVDKLVEHFASSFTDDETPPPAPNGKAAH